MPTKLTKWFHILFTPILRKVLHRAVIHQLLADEAALIHLPATKLMFPSPAAMAI